MGGLRSQLRACLGCRSKEIILRPAIAQAWWMQSCISWQAFQYLGFEPCDEFWVISCNIAGFVFR